MSEYCKAICLTRMHAAPPAIGSLSPESQIKERVPTCMLANGLLSLCPDAPFSVPPHPPTPHPLCPYGFCVPSPVLLPLCISASVSLAVSSAFCLCFLCVGRRVLLWAIAPGGWSGLVWSATHLKIRRRAWRGVPLMHACTRSIG